MLGAGASAAAAAALAAPPPAPVPSPGFTITTFAGPLTGSTAPDSIAVVGNSVWVAYGTAETPMAQRGEEPDRRVFLVGKVKRNLG